MSDSPGLEDFIVRLIGVANGSSKTMSLAKFSSNFTGLAALFFFQQLFMSCSLFKAKKVLKYRFVCLFYLNINGV